MLYTLEKYGRLNDGRHSLESVLEIAKNYVGQERCSYCENLIQELHAFNDNTKCGHEYAESKSAGSKSSEQALLEDHSKDKNAVAKAKVLDTIENYPNPSDVTLMVEIESSRTKKVKIDGMNGREFIVKIPQNANEGTRLKLKGAGLATRGDLYLKLNYASIFKNNIFDRGSILDGNSFSNKTAHETEPKTNVLDRLYHTPNKYDVTMILEINLLKTDRNEKIIVNGVDGKKLLVRVPQIGIGGTTVRLEGQGLSGNGDLYLSLHYP